eukprot:TRINITY_DN58621_c0_g1_i1.p1 TRINITY_DN58621_c0_g1~~TRINITY_DN58621_c0_g1_i1.p1  ORF type:complete len:164 (-),score=19.65 TRINITY_DN58621_c0_g1_i1:55-546(-)
MQRGLVGSEMCIRDRRRVHGDIMKRNCTWNIIAATIILSIDSAILIGFLASVFIKDNSESSNKKINFISYSCNIKMSVSQTIAMILLIFDIVLMTLHIVQHCKRQTSTKMVINYLIILNFMYILLIIVDQQQFFGSILSHIFILLQITAELFVLSPIIRCLFG